MFSFCSLWGGLGYITPIIAFLFTLASFVLLFVFALKRKRAVVISLIITSVAAFVCSTLHMFFFGIRTLTVAGIAIIILLATASLCLVSSLKVES